MSDNGLSPPDGNVLAWPRKLLSADDLRHHLNGHRELALLPRTVVTPLAADELKARGVRIRWQDAAPVEAATMTTATNGWAYADERNDAQVTAAVNAYLRDGGTLTSLVLPVTTPWQWAVAVANAVADAGYTGGIVFASDPALVCCLANKIVGLRAAPVTNVAQASRARIAFGANLIAVEMPGRTFFELRQLLRTVCGSTHLCPEPVANTLKELDGHAHR